MTTEELAAGKEVLAYCGKCKLPLAHTIANMDEDGRIGKCECKTCGALHNYRDPETKKAPPKKGSRAKKTVPVEEIWKQAVEMAKGESKAYAMDGEFDAGDLIEHPTFGKGVVEQIVDGKKIRTLFETGHKMLIQKQ